MTKLKRFIWCLWGILAIMTTSQGQDWRGIVPLHSTRQDVERLIGRPTESNGITYNLKEERVSIYYSTSACANGWPYGWNVPAGTVIRINTYTQTKLTLKELRIDLSKFTMSRDLRGEGLLLYHSGELGMTVAVRESDQGVVGIDYEPAAKDKNFMCPAAAEREREIESKQATYVAPNLYYFDVSPKEERVRLEFFADQLKKYSSDSTIYIIGYGGSEACPNEAINRAKRAREYLLRRPQKVAGRRIFTIDGGRNSSVWVELYVVPPGEPRPLSTPDIHPRFAKIKNCPSTAKGKRPSNR